MGYVPARPPSGIIVLPEGSTWQAVDELRADFGQQWIGDPPRTARPPTGYSRYRFDLYGPERRDWMPVFGWGLVAAVIALPVVVVLVVAGVL